MRNQILVYVIHMHFTFYWWCHIPSHKCLNGSLFKEVIQRKSWIRIPFTARVLLKRKLKREHVRMYERLLHKNQINYMTFMELWWNMLYPSFSLHACFFYSFIVVRRVKSNLWPLLYCCPVLCQSWLTKTRSNTHTLLLQLLSWAIIFV